MQDIKDTIKEVVYAVIPITLVVFILQFTIIWLPLEVFLQFLVGVAFVSIGLILFLLGVQTGLLPVGERIGSALPQTKKLWMILFFGFLLGFVVTIAEPDVRVLANQIDLVSNGEISSNLLIYSVALGVGFFVSLALLRIILNIKITHILIVGYGIAFLLAAFTPPSFVPISFDSGGVTTGPLTVPFILALGVGVASVLKGKATSSDSFGLVALASIGPIIAVLLLGVIFG